MKECHKFSICETCADAPAGTKVLTAVETREIIKTKIGPELAAMERMDANNGLDSFIEQLVISGVALQEKAHRPFGLDCYNPRYWRT